jgi:hypothetical protein
MRPIACLPAATTFLAAATLLTACASGDGAPPTEALGLPEDVRVVGHAEQCDGDVCTRHLLVGPGLEAGPEIASVQAIEQQIIRGLRAEGWTERARTPAYVARSDRDGATATITRPGEPVDAALTAPPLRTQLRTMLDAGQPVVAVTLTPD